MVHFIRNNEDLELICKSLKFLNMNELKAICKKYEIPYNIFIKSNGEVKKTNEVDHKEVIINNIKYFLIKSLIKSKIPKKNIIQL